MTVKGKSIIMTSGRQSGRCTCAAVLCDRIIDPTVPASLSMPIVIMCGVHQERRLKNLLAEAIADHRVSVLTDLQYKEKPFHLIRAPPPSYRDETNSSAPLFIVVGNAEHLDAFCVADALSRFEERPQVITLLDEPFPQLEEALLNVSRAFSHSWVFLTLAIRGTFRRVINSIGGSGYVCVPAPEEDKYKTLTDLVSNMFDYQLFAIVVATRRKAEKLAAAFGRVMPCTAVNYRAPQTIADAETAVLNAITKNTELMDELPYGTRTAMVKSRHAVVCDLHAISLLSAITGRLDAVIFYDIPETPSNIEKYSREYFTPTSTERVDAPGMGYQPSSGRDPRGSPTRRIGDRGMASSTSSKAAPFTDGTTPILTVAFADTDDEYRRLRNSSSVRWITVDA